MTTTTFNDGTDPWAISPPTQLERDVEELLHACFHNDLDTANEIMSRQDDLVELVAALCARVTDLRGVVEKVHAAIYFHTTAE